LLTAILSAAASKNSKKYALTITTILLIRRNTLYFQTMQVTDKITGASHYIGTGVDFF